jgi:ABC-type glutathione transport system ATPase component
MAWLFQTHNVAMVASLARYAVIIRDGHVHRHGAPKDVLENDQLILTEVKDELEVMEKAEQEIDAPKAPDGAATPGAGKAPSDGKLVVEEEVAIGHVGWKARMLFLPFASLLACLICC